MHAVRYAALHVLDAYLRHATATNHLCYRAIIPDRIEYLFRFQNIMSVNLTAMGLNYFIVSGGGAVRVSPCPRVPVLHYIYTGLSTFHACGVSACS